MGRVYQMAPPDCHWPQLCERLRRQRLRRLRIAGSVLQQRGKIKYLNQVPADEDLAASQSLISAACLKFKHDTQIPHWQLFMLTRAHSRSVKDTVWLHRSGCRWPAAAGRDCSSERWAGGGIHAPPSEEETEDRQETEQGGVGGLDQAVTAQTMTG